MNSLLVCPHCNGAISRVTQACPNCGELTGYGRSRSSFGRGQQASAQSVIAIVIDALRTRPGQRGQVNEPMKKMMSES